MENKANRYRLTHCARRKAFNTDDLAVIHAESNFTEGLKIEVILREITIFKSCLKRENYVNELEMISETVMTDVSEILESILQEVIARNMVNFAGIYRRKFSKSLNENIYGPEKRADEVITYFAAAGAEYNTLCCYV